MCKIYYHEDEWIGEAGKFIVIDVTLESAVYKVNKLLKEIASDDSDNPARLYASNAYTSLKLLLNKLDEEKSRDSSEDAVDVPETLGDKNVKDEGVAELPNIVADVVLKFMHGINQWSGTHTELLDRLNKVATREQLLHDSWPRGANVLSTRIKKAEAFLAKKHIEIYRKRGGNTRSIMLSNSLAVY